MRVKVCYGNSGWDFDRVCHVRQSVAGESEFNFDRYSHHYLFENQGEPVGVMTVHRAEDGDLDCQSYYPEALVQQFRTSLVSVCKLRFLRDSRCPSSCLRSLIRAAWRHQLPRGIRFAILNTETSLAPFYRRIGFRRLDGFDFVHPQLGTDSQVMLMAADPDVRSFCNDLFRQIADPVCLEQGCAAARAETIEDFSLTAA
ncbi:MAG: hypothetical protein AAF539_05150 [Planctomycetota bacterium]